MVAQSLSPAEPLMALLLRAGLRGLLQLLHPPGIQEPHLHDPMTSSITQHAWHDGLN